MTKHDSRVTLAQIEEAAEKVEVLCRGKTFETFSEDWVAVMALERLFLIIGEAVEASRGFVWTVSRGPMEEDCEHP